MSWIKQSRRVRGKNLPLTSGRSLADSSRWFLGCLKWDNSSGELQAQHPSCKTVNSWRPTWHFCKEKKSPSCYGRISHGTWKSHRHKQSRVWICAREKYESLPHELYAQIRAEATNKLSTQEKWIPRSQRDRKQVFFWVLTICKNENVLAENLDN